MVAEAERINSTRKEVQKVKREYKKQEVLRDQQQEIIKETSLLMEKIRKEFTIINSEIRGQTNKEEEVKKDMAIVVDKTEDIKGKISISENKKKDIEMEIKKLEKTL